MKLLLWPATIVVALYALTLASAHPLVRVNWTPSMPEGVYLARYGAPAIRRGQTVLVCLPMSVAAVGQARGYIGPGDCPDGSAVLLKRVAAVPGDTVTIGAGGLAVNGTLLANTRPLPFDSKGRAMRAMRPGSYTVTADSFWVVADHDPRSWDSRYFGALPADALLGIAQPLLTF